MSFTRCVESFTCEHCGLAVSGNGYTNHCPNCLWSKHVDVSPGDRLARCGGLMRPIAARYQNDCYIIIHICEQCGKRMQNRAASSDATDILISLTTSPYPMAAAHQLLDA